MNHEKVRAAIANLPDPETGRPIGQTRQIYQIEERDGKVYVQIGLTSFCSPLKSDFQSAVEEKLRIAFPDQAFEVEIVHHDRPPVPLGSVGLTAKAVIAVGSGKGGVGKSTVATGLALALQKSGARVGLLDTDVYGPSLPQLTGVRGEVTKSGDKIGPLDYNGMPVMSIGFMVPPDQAVIWRGPMLHSAVTTFVRDVDWGMLDYLIIDMPPGTGDVALSLSQLLPLTGAIVVCTPQDVALIDAIKAVSMFQKMKIPISGVVENMSGFECPDCHKRYDIFGKGGAREYAEQAGLPFLGEIPLTISIRERGDEGAMGACVQDPQSAPYFDRIAYQFAKTLAQRASQSPATMQLPVLG